MLPCASTCQQQHRTDLSLWMWWSGGWVDGRDARPAPPRPAPRKNGLPRPAPPRRK